MSESGWAGVSAAATGLLADPDDASVTDLLLDIRHATAGQSYLEWVRYQHAARLHHQLVEADETTDRRCLDSLSRCATRVAVTLSITQSAAERLLDTSIALRDRLPMVSDCLRDGLITARDVKMIVERTDLLTDPDHQHAVDADIAATFRRGGSWSSYRMRDMIDRIVFRADPVAVRARRKAAVDARSFWMDRGEQGMATISATMTAEKAIALTRRVAALAGCVCRNDPRSKSARGSDALFCLTMGVAWECQCGNPDCGAAPVPDPTGPASRDVPGTTGTTAVVHVICDLETAAGDGENPGFIDGYGVVSSDHLRDILHDPSTTIRPIGADDTPLAPHQPGNPYRPSTALDTAVRVRGLYCEIPGCNRAGWVCDIDHVEEYNHHNPAEGGATSRANTGTKCQFHHNMKTFSEFIDTISTDDCGRTHTAIVTPEGLIVPGPAFTGDDLFPSLRDIGFADPTHAPPVTDPDATTGDPEEPTRGRTRLANKHARRRTERTRNQETIDNAAAAATATKPDPIIDIPPGDATPSWESFPEEPPF